MPVLPLPAAADAPLARIDLTALAANARAVLTRVSPRGLLAVVKWDGYGHGLVPCAKTLVSAGATAFGVSSPEDGKTLRLAGITQPILVMTDWVGQPPEMFLDWNLEAAATSWYKVEYLAMASRTLGRSIPTHIKFDTGLGRVGLHHNRAAMLLPKIARMKDLAVVGLYSHLAFSGPQDEVRGYKQIEIFQNIVAQAAALGIAPRWIHLANSAAAMALPDVPGNLVRTGIALYGQPPSPEVHRLLPLSPVMTLIGKVRSVRRLKRGHGFPFPHFWTAPTDGWGAEVALGYKIGYPRSLAGRAHVLFRGQRRPLVGVVGQDSSYIFTGSLRPEIGEEVVYWGRQGGETLYLFELSSPIGALPYELPTWLSHCLELVFVEDVSSVQV